MDGQAFYSDSPWTWKDRLRFKLFPSRPCLLPEAPATYENCLITTTIVCLDWKDRIRVFLSGLLKIETKTVTEYTIGDHVTSSTSYPILSLKQRS